MPSIAYSLDTASLHALTSANVVLIDEVVPATVVYCAESGKIVAIIRKDDHPVSEDSSPAGSGSDEEMPEYYDRELDRLGVSPENHRDLGDLVLLPGLVDAHVHLNEVSSYNIYFFYFFFSAKDYNFVRIKDSTSGLIRVLIK